MKYSGRTTSHSHKFDNWQSNKPDGSQCVRKVTLIDVQWSTCPIEIENIVRELWSSYALGNDFSCLKFSDFNQLSDICGDEDSFLTFKEYLESQGVKDNEECIIHWWW